MRRYCLIIFSFALLFLSSNAQAKLAVELTVKGAIGPATVEYIDNGIQFAEQQHAALIILTIDTPGGLATSMRDIVQRIIQSPIAVVGFVAPSGAHAASAGTFILYATNIAAMAPGTNLGAATPVAIGGPAATPTPATDKQPDKKTASSSELKSLNDAKAYIRSLAQLRDRNVEWAEQAVSSAVSLSAEEALKIKVIDFIASDTQQLLTKLDGREVTVNGQKIKLATNNIQLKQFAPNWRVKFLSIITDPNIAYILLLIGIYGLIFEFANPGFILPGVAGAICILVAAYAFQLLPVSYVGLGLIVVGIGFMIAEAFVSSFGALGIGGIIAFIVGSIFLMDTASPAFQIAWPVIIAVAIVTGLFFLLVVNMAIKSRFRPVVSGREELINSRAEVIAVGAGHARVRLRGEIWQVESSEPLVVGDSVKVIGREGLILKVTKEKAS